MTFGENLKAARKRAGLTQDQIAQHFGITRAAVTQWEGEATLPEPARLKQLAELLQTTTDHLLGNGSPSTWKVSQPPSVRPPGIPIVGTAQLGDAGYYEELQYPAGHGEGYIDIPSRDPNAYALRVKGDSMRPRIKPGEFVLVEPNRAPAIGDDVVVKTADGRSMVKQLSVQRDGWVELRSVNEQHAPITLDEKDIVAMHKVLAIVSRDLVVAA